MPGAVSPGREQAQPVIGGIREGQVRERVDELRLHYVKTCIAAFSYDNINRDTIHAKESHQNVSTHT